MSNSDCSREEWIDLPGYGEDNDDYKLSSFGRVLSRRSLMILKPTLKKDKGYLKVGLCSKGRNTSHEIHKLVARHFIGPRPYGLITDHIDGNKLNNKVSNLQYITPRANTLKGNSMVNSASKYAGVQKSGKKKPWRARIAIKGKSIYLGVFDTELEAAYAYSKVWMKCG